MGRDRVVAAMTTFAITDALVVRPYERYRVPLPGGPWTSLWVGAVVSGWCELTDDPEREVLSPKSIRVGSRGRFARGLANRGVALRFGVGDDEAVLVMAQATERVRDLLLVPVRQMRDGACLQRPLKMFARAGWTSPWSEADLRHVRPT